MTMLAHVVDVAGGMFAAIVLPALGRALLRLRRRQPVQIFHGRCFPHPNDDRWTLRVPDFADLGPITIDRRRTCASRLFVNGVVVDHTRQVDAYYEAIEGFVRQRELDKALEAIP